MTTVIDTVIDIVKALLFVAFVGFLITGCVMGAQKEVMKQQQEIEDRAAIRAALEQIARNGSAPEVGR